MIRVLFVCLGNICRSPMAEAIFRSKVESVGLSDQIDMDSAGTGDWHVGEPPHEGTTEILSKQKISTNGIRARQVKKVDLDRFEYVVAMDAANLGELHEMAGMQPASSISRLMDYVTDSEFEDVPDPYFDGNFEQVYEMVTEGCEKLLEHIREDKGI
ncbi:low molecular weight protein-tyrosine-phosphatase [Pseudalkalibacillus hwajinpoensis]|uniref:protein-tyrosine-phosphatase n=1 Tax=Guptibacillus hwajinpoensis TaxID=208199 RepID=A0A4U1MD98_9BACL|nr:low molecular weight protein-tyrosine-phosphatase [Pseudalkalibacillus hwajinpoensis]TKD68315.1 low molecular weight phosphotyrosine protein phosphatase [Pseudalkalibacillus hwajinpoensis]